MSCFRIPGILCYELENMMAKFWWGQRKDENKIRWVSREKLCEAKAMGGMGFMDMQTFNLALLAKQGWRVFQEEASLLNKM